MAKFADALRGYAFLIHKRDNFTCRYCGLDGRSSFGSWLSLSWDHLLPKDHADRNEPEFIVTACMFCNTADNHYFRHAEKRGVSFEGKTPEALVAQRLPYVQTTRNNYLKFFEEYVKLDDDKGTGSSDES